MILIVSWCHVLDRVKTMCTNTLEYIDRDRVTILHVSLATEVIIIMKAKSNQSSRQNVIITAGLACAPDHTQTAVRRTDHTQTVLHSLCMVSAKIIQKLCYAINNFHPNSTRQGKFMHI